MASSCLQGDSLLFDMSSATEGSPQIFVRRDWLSILDNMNNSYVGNQSIIDTSQLSNSNKYMSYYEGVIIFPLLLTLTGTTAGGAQWLPATNSTNDYTMGLKNSLLTMIHSFTLDMNGTTIVQQTPFVNLWNNFCLLTTFNYNDFTEWASIGFYPDTANSWNYNTTANSNGGGSSNNQNYLTPLNCNTGIGSVTIGNIGFLKRQQFFNYDPAQGAAVGGSAAGNIFNATACNNAYKSYMFYKADSTAGSVGIVQQAIIGQIKLRHLHNFWNEIPLVKGTFFKLTINVNNTSATFTKAATPTLVQNSVTCPLGGCNPLMIASSQANSGSGTNLPADTYIVSLSLGGTCLNTQQVGQGAQQSTMLRSVMLNVPSYVFNPIFEQAYISQSAKTIVYNDLYQYQVLNTLAGQTFNQLITNGIAGIQTVVVIPFYNASSNGNVTPFQSLFATEGGGTTSPLCILGNFNVVISGQNAIYNTERFTYEQFTQQLYGMGSVNGGLTNGVNSGLIDQLAFENNYNYYAINVSRMLPIEESVPKSVNIIGTNLTSLAIDMYVFVNYKTSVTIDVLTGSRV